MQNGKIKSRVSGGFGAWLQAQNISVVLTTYRANRLIFLGSNLDGEIRIQERLLDRPMGIFNHEKSIWIAGRSHLWRYDNLLDNDQEY